jgi:hypothetical protein
MKQTSFFAALALNLAFLETGSWADLLHCWRPKAGRALQGR